jgi:hypothetical protein
MRSTLLARLAAAAAAAALAMLSLAAGVAAAEAIPAKSVVDARNLLDRHAGFSSADLAALDRGQPIARTMPSNGAISTAGAIRLDVSRSGYLDAFRRIDEFKRCKEIPEIGIVSPVPSEADFAGLTGCPDCRAALLGAAAAFFREGDRRAESAALLADSGYVPDDVRVALLRFPEDGGASESFLYWAKEKLAGQTLYTLTHAMVLRGGDVDFIATRQVYASKYVAASLGFTALYDAPGGGIRLVYLNRTRVPALGGFFRDLAARAVASGMKRKLAELRLKLAPVAARR